jgi:hypothetical protein
VFLDSGTITPTDDASVRSDGAGPDAATPDAPVPDAPAPTDTASPDAAADASRG